MCLSFVANGLGLLLAQARTDSFPVGMRGSINEYYDFEIFKVGNKKYMIIAYYDNRRYFEVMEVH